jgi:hypothetical protein
VDNRGVSDPGRPRQGDQSTAWERAWDERYASPKVRRRAPRGRPRRDVLLAALVLGIVVSSVAFADVDGLGKKAGTDKVKCDSNKNECVLYQNKGKAEAVRFKSKGSVPFTVKSSNTGLVENLNADLLDGQHAADFLGKGERAADSALLEGKDASAFLGVNQRAANSALLQGRPASAFLGATAKAADSETLDGQDSGAFLGATAKAADADKLDGLDSLDLVRFAGAVFTDGDPAGIGFTSSKTATGVYRVEFPAGSFKTATSCRTPIPMVVAHSDTAVIATVAVGMATCNAVDGSGGFTAKTFTAAGAAVDSAFWFMVR